MIASLILGGHFMNYNITKSAIFADDV